MVNNQLFRQLAYPLKEHTGVEVVGIQTHGGKPNKIQLDIRDFYHPSDNRQVTLIAEKPEGETSELSDKIKAVLDKYFTSHYINLCFCNEDHIFYVLEFNSITQPL